MHEMCRKQKYKVETQDITWKTHNGGKNHDSPRALEYTIRKEYYNGSARATTSSTSHFATRGGGYKMEATVGKHVPPDGRYREPVPIGSNQLEGHICKYAEESYVYKYDLGHIF